MGNFLTCFSSSKRKIRKQKNNGVVPLQMMCNCFSWKDDNNFVSVLTVVQCTVFCPLIGIKDGVFLALYCPSYPGSGFTLQLEKKNCMMCHEPLGDPCAITPLFQQVFWRSHTTFEERPILSSLQTDSRFSLTKYLVIWEFAKVCYKHLALLLYMSF